MSVFVGERAKAVPQPRSEQREDSAMEIADLARRAVDMRERIAEFERKNYGAEWTTTDLVSGLMTDVGDLAAAIQRVPGRRPVRDIAPMEELEHELGDCLWVLLVLAERFDIDLDAAFDSTMVSIDSWLNRAVGSEPAENVDATKLPRG